MDVGRRAKIRRAIIDKEAKILSGAQIGFDPKEDSKSFPGVGGDLVI